MTVALAGRTVMDLGARATVLDAMDRIRASGPDDELVLVVPAGAPLLRNAAFLEVLRRAAGHRRLALVTPDARARSLASAVHVAAFASVAALERHELDPTEPLGPVRRAAIVRAEPKRSSPVGAIVVTLALLLAGGVLFGVLAPSATVVVAPVSVALGPMEFDLRAGPGGDIGAQTRVAQVSATFTGTATGSRTEDTKAKGTVRLTNQTTGEVRVPQGTVVRTSDGVRFQTTQDATIPKSSIVIFPPSVKFGTVDVGIEALEPGPGGNVAAGKITISPQPGQYGVENQAATSGGDSKKIPIVTLADYDLAASRADAELQTKADAQLQTWKTQAASGHAVYGVRAQRTGLTPAGDVVGVEGKDTFQLTVNGTATGYDVDASEPRAAAVSLLRQAAPAENEIDAEGATVDTVLGPTVQDDGVHWRVRAKTLQFHRVNEAAISAALAGHPFEEASGIVTDLGLSLRRISTWPGWWPRMPFLDVRIAVEKEATPSSAVP